MSVRKVEIRGRQVGVIDLEEIFQEVKTAGIRDVEQLKDLILEKVKVKNYVPFSLEQEYREELYEEYRVFAGEIQSRTRTGNDIEIRLYGASCSRCERIDATVMDTLSRSGIKADYQYITDIAEMSRSGIMTTPTLTVSGKVVIMGQVPSENQVEKMLLQAIDSAKVQKD